MSKLTYAQIRQTLNGIAADKCIGQRSFETSVAIDSDDCWLGTWWNDRMYVLVQASLADPALNRTLIDVHAGAAYGLTPSADLFEMLTGSFRIDYGGPWSRRLPDGKVAFGWRARYPSEFFHEENHADAFGFLMGMIWEFGRMGVELADEFIPRFGGFPCRGNDPDAFKALLAGIVPPQ